MMTRCRNPPPWPELKELFRNLRDRTEKGKEKLARNANMLMDF